MSSLSNRNTDNIRSVTYYQLIFRLSLLNNYYGNNNTKICFVCKKRDYWVTRYTKEKSNKVKKGFKRRVHQQLIDNDIDDNFNKDITAIVFNILTLTTVLTITSGNFFYNNYSIEHFITLNRLILIKTAKNIVIFINNNTFTYSLTGSTEPGGIKPNIIRRGNKVNIKNLIVNINFLNCYFNNNGQDLALLSIFPYSL